ncbi:MAG: hypothetical protein ACKVPX_03690 [Myxococcaceae bacterium]
MGTDSETRIQIHEAGHALLAYLNGSDVTLVLHPKDAPPDVPMYVLRSNSAPHDRDALTFDVVNCSVFYLASAALSVASYELLDPYRELSRRTRYAWRDGSTQRRRSEANDSVS